MDNQYRKSTRYQLLEILFICSLTFCLWVKNVPFITSQANYSMKRKFWRLRRLQLGLAGCCSLVGAYALTTSEQAHAQITPDATLSSESSVVTPNLVIRDLASDRIDGGAIRGSNLFHSFREFNVGEARGVYFTHPEGIKNILTRVTGTSRSEILGRLGVLGNANLFLLNPNGILFGQNARLDIQGSFIGSTANSLKFADGFEYSATAPQSTSLLSISVPVGLQYGANPGGIQVIGDGQGIRATSDFIDTTNALRVEPNQTLALVGGDMSLEGATIKTAGGRIELGSVAGDGFVSLAFNNKGFALGYDGVQNFGNIQLSQQTAVDASGAGAGDIQVVGGRVTVSHDSQIEASTLATESGGSLKVIATELLKITSISSDDQLPISGLFSEVYPGATGNGGDLTINTSELLIQDGAVVRTTTRGSGKGVNLAITANKVQVSGGSSGGRFLSGLFSQAERRATGDAGDLTINTSELLIQNGAQVGTITIGSGKAGNLTVRANKVQLIGTSSDGRFVSGLSSAAIPGSTGKAGDLTINTSELLIQNGAQVDTSTFGSGKAGNLTVRANKVQVIGGSSDGRISSGLYSSATSGSSGNAGDLMINTSELLIQNGALVSTSTFGSGKGGNLTVRANKVQVIGGSSDGRVSSGLYSVAGSGSTGNGGDLTINTSELLIQDGALVTAQGRSQGNAGNITINVDGLLRTTNGDITSSAQRSSGGAITITAKDIRLFGDSDITTNVFSGVGGGGNINLNANSIIALNDSDILAFARDGRGGNITLNTPAFFGQNYQPILSGADRLTLDSNNRVNFNATGDLSSGIITLPETSLVQNSFIELPQNLIDTSSLIASSCIARRNQKQQGSFMITGSGGLPFRPGDAVMSQYATGSVRTISNASASENSTHRAWQKGSPIVEAQDVYQLPSGQLVLSRECP
ncbi:filamentous hemagglutinin-like protein (plasmid) [Scytonema sp. HK-05]|nr:filamentous hemagglutinin-like protein [Scytonema sp. HK-05]